MNVLDLFSGIGGFSLGLERAGMRTVAFCEIEPFCRAVLRKHWPGVPCYDDIRTLTADRLRADGISVDVICGGFPCQDISFAGKGAGIDGERSGLWSEYARLIGELRPRYVIVENVAALLSRGLDRVLGHLATLRYDAEWHCIPASAIGAPHRRDRIWILAYPNSGLHAGRLVGRGNRGSASRGKGGDAGEREALHRQWLRSEPGASSADVANAKPGGLATRDEQHDQGGTIFLAQGSCERGRHSFRETWWPEPNVGRVAYGLPFAMERIEALGNAVVPQIPEIIGRAIMNSAKD